MPVGHSTRVLVLGPVLGMVLASMLPPGPAEAAPTRVPIDQWPPLAAAGDITPSAEAMALRNSLLGDNWDDPEYVTLHWTGVSSFVVTISGHLLLFDAWEIIGAVEDYLPIGREELAGLEPEAILVGHGHFDHAGDLGYVAGLTGAAVIGSDEICTVAEEGAVREGVAGEFPCAITGTADTPAPGTMQQFVLFEDVAPVSVLQHIHSAATFPDDVMTVDPALPIMDPQPYLEHFQDNPEELMRFIGQQQESNQGGTWLYQLADGDFTIVLGDSAGPIFTDEATTTALGEFPGCVDVLANAILGFDQPVSGLQDPVLYLEAMQPQVFIPTHGDAWAPVLSAGQAQYVDLLQAEMEEHLETIPEVDFLLDPQDYMVERAYRVDDPRWTEAVAGSSCAAAAEPADTTSNGDGTEGADDGEQSPGLPSTGGGVGLAVFVLLGAVSTRRARR